MGAFKGGAGPRHKAPQEPDPWFQTMSLLAAE